MAVRVYLGFDDTDMPDADRGTGKLVRWFGDALPEGCTLWGVVRQQLLVAPEIPYTSHNSSACAVVDAPGGASSPNHPARRDTSGTPRPSRKRPGALCRL
jgi:hypothetical protein